jgi:hypothetical protein
VTVFVTTHYMEEAEYCNRLALIFRGKMVALGTPSELKQNSMKGELLLVECEPLGNAVEASAIGSGRDGCRGLRQRSAPGGAGCHRGSPQVQKYLSDHSITVSRIEKIRPSLEDVFVSLTPARAIRERRRAKHELHSLAGRGSQRSHPDPPRLAQPDHCRDHARDSVLLFGYGVNLDLKGLPVYVYDRDGSQQSQDLLKRFQASEYFTLCAS